MKNARVNPAVQGVSMIEVELGDTGAGIPFEVDAEEGRFFF